LFGQEPVFHAGALSVKVDVQVTDKNLHSIPGLKQEDFAVFDNGQQQPIAYFGQDTEPLDILLLLDVSGSMHSFLEEMGANARSALGQLHPGDRVGVMLFAWKTDLRQALTGDFGAVEQEIRNSVRNRPGDGTQINAAILDAARYFAGQPAKGRRAVLMVTDGQGLNYQSPDEDAIRALYKCDAVLNAIMIGKTKRPRQVKPGRYVNPDFTPADVPKISEQTGGEIAEAGKETGSFSRMIEHIRARYSIQYNAPAAQPGAFRQIRVELTPEARRRHPDAVIRARAGYFGSSQPSADGNQLPDEHGQHAFRSVPRNFPTAVPLPASQAES